MENNDTIIAEFMGKKVYQLHHESNYSQSWNWLMPVVKECFELAYKFDGKDTNVVGDITCGMLNTDIEETYQSVVQFINELKEEEEEIENFLDTLRGSLVDKECLEKVLEEYLEGEITISQHSLKGDYWNTSYLINDTTYIVTYLLTHNRKMYVDKIIKK
jgi:hypothetical protein